MSNGSSMEQEIPSEFVRFYTHDEISMSTNDPLGEFNDQKAVMALVRFKIAASSSTTTPTSAPFTSIARLPADHPFNVTFSGTGAGKISLSKIVKCPHAWDGTFHAASYARADLNERQEESYLKKGSPVEPP
jgi:hypothetical protein